MEVEAAMVGEDTVLRLRMVVVATVVAPVEVTVAGDMAVRPPSPHPPRRLLRVSGAWLQPRRPIQFRPAGSPRVRASPCAHLQRSRM